MALPPFSVDTTKPTDNDFVSQFPANERANRDEIESIIAEEHDVASGHHKLAAGDDTARDAVTDWVQGAVFVNTSHTPPRLQRQTAASSPFSWTDIVEFPTGTKMVFKQASAPTGWTQDTSTNDKVLRVVSGAPGADGGSWTISGISVDDHTLTIDEIPAHTHSTLAPHQSAQSIGGGSDIPSAAGGMNAVTGSTGGGSGHSHTLTIGDTWRPAYSDVIVASKD